MRLFWRGGLCGNRPGFVEAVPYGVMAVGRVAGRSAGCIVPETDGAS